MTKINYKDFVKYLFKNFRFKVIQILILSILETLLEILSIIAIIGALTIILTKDTSYGWLANFVGKFEYDFENQLSLFYLIIFIYIIKNASLALIQWLKLDLCGKIFKNISQSTYQALLKKNNLFFNNFSSGDLAQNVISESEFTKSVIISFVAFITELLIIMMMFVLIGLHNFYAALITIIFLSISSYIYYFFMKQKNISLGEKRQLFSIRIMNLLFNSLAQHKLIVLADKIKFFLNKFSNMIKVIYQVSRDQMTIQYSSRLWLECCVLLILVFTITPLIKSENISSTKISDILLISVITLRFVPSFSNILGSYSTIQYGVKAVSNIMNILKDQKDESIIQSTSIQFNELILRSVYFKYENNKEFVIEDFNQILQNKSLVGIKGDNGSGKSTLLKIIAGLIEPDNGQVTINQKSIYDDEILFYNWKKNVGFADQKLIFSNESVLKTVAFGDDDRNISQAKVADCLEKVGLLEFFMSKTDKLNMLIGENGLKLSGGQLQKLNIARALYLRPKILILDEVTNNLDIKSQEELLKLLNLLKNESLIIMATHSDNILKKCDLIINL
ncbi:ATP-binding cassette domain-containing protein [Candidatus Pelagibacter communis]|uniref:ATP-binding cassette domain-containing protein n=1 Tax=Pelagibacter ubique TaxID=198252 RepID=UPI00092D3519|nr:ABC transporter ATP-binding protein [Candidatus Pelagibacter ubique]